MKKPFKEDQQGMFIVAAGWLFADMLLALAMLFLAANTIGIHPPPLPPATTPTSKSIAATPTPTPIAHLEQKFHRFMINVDANGLLNGSQSATHAEVGVVAGGKGGGCIPMVLAPRKSIAS